LKAYKDVQRKLLTPIHRLQRIWRARQLRRRFANGLHMQIVFSDEVPFIILQHHNAQNNRTWHLGPPDKEDTTVERVMKPAGVLIWGAIGYNFKSRLQICPQGLKIDTPAYLRIMRRRAGDDRGPSSRTVLPLTAPTRLSSGCWRTSPT
jgi:hypothetical protein